MSTTRRALLAAGAGLALARPALAQAAPKVVVIGGGFGGATAARALRRGGLDIFAKRTTKASGRR